MGASLLKILPATQIPMCVFLLNIDVSIDNAESVAPQVVPIPISKLGTSSSYQSQSQAGCPDVCNLNIRVSPRGKISDSFRPLSLETSNFKLGNANIKQGEIESR